jgi:hypothetical protein
MHTTRRNFIRISTVAASSVAVLSQMLPAAVRAAGFAGNPMSLEECLALDCKQVAERSAMVRDGWAYLLNEVEQLQDASLRGLVAEIYADSSPRLAAIDAKQRAEVWKALQAEGYTAQNAEVFLPVVPDGMKTNHPYIAAPGSGYGSHHAYPGGLVTHVATNVRITRNIVDTYSQVYGYAVNRDVAMAAQLLHDLHKPWVFQWQANASSRQEQPLAGTGEHHVLSAAELIVRKAPAELVVAQACAHTHPGWAEEEAQVVNWLKAAAIIGGVDPVAYGLLDKSGKTLPLPRRQEGFICHLGDHDFVLSMPAVQWTLPVMKEIAASDYKISEKDLEGKPFNSLRNTVYASLSAMRLEHIYTTGRENLRRAMHSVVLPV